MKGKRVSKVQDMSRGGWVIIGFVFALLLVPTGMAAAAALKYVGIEGTSTNKVDVSAAGQLLTAPAGPSSSYNNWTEEFSTYTAIATPPAGKALIVTSIHVDTRNGGSGEVAVGVSINGCTSGAVFDQVDPSSNGVTVLPYEPGVVVPSGDTLCAFPSDWTLGNVTVSGYTVPAAAG